MNIIVRNDTYVVEIHCVEDDDSLGIANIGDALVPYRHADMEDNILTLEIPFKDLTIYDHTSFEARCARLMDVEKNDGDDRGDS